MKSVDTHAGRKKSHVMIQLEKHGIYDNEGYTYSELLRKLEVASALEVKDDKPWSSWF